MANKMKITGYKIITWKQKVKVSPKPGADANAKPETKTVNHTRVNRDDKKEYTVQVNPGSYKLSYKSKYAKNQAPGKIGNFLKFNKSKPEVLDVEFIFDKTGSIPDTFTEKSDIDIRKMEQEDGIIPELEAFKKVVYDYDGKQHKPRYLLLTWGNLRFKGVLTEMTVEFKLFLPDGTPIRANVKAKFEGSIEDDLENAKMDNQSADVSHVVQVKAGDKLPLLSYQVYDDPGYYLQVARANGLVNFRSLQTGRRLRFPPVKTE